MHIKSIARVIGKLLLTDKMTKHQEVMAVIRWDRDGPFVLRSW
jgi:hypothetical protein